MEILSKNKGIILTAILIMLVIFVYNTFLSSSSLFSSGNLSTPSIGGEVLKMSNDLQAVNFDQQIFTSPGFLLLTNFSLEVPQKPIGRNNPFGNIGQN
ncbi:hypothetical protein GW944_00455 [Candidatus Parcubacteria bacterium]|nr:hypothetical protein [Candidatus Parcubacteria bacterium]